MRAAIQRPLTLAIFAWPHFVQADDPQAAEFFERASAAAGHEVGTLGAVAD
jgi:hypothetical protein